MRGWWLLAMATACSDRALVSQRADEDGGTVGSSGTSTTASSTTSTSTPTPTSGGSTFDGTGSASTDTSSDDGVGFAVPPDGGNGRGEECTAQLQDCAPGLKCMPYARDEMRGDWWAHEACFPIVDDPKGFYEPCAYEDYFMSGHDDCGWAMLCWGWYAVDDAKCVGLCFDEPRPGADWLCEDPTADAVIECQECPCVCQPTCDPTVQPCEAGYGCYPTTDAFVCYPDSSFDGGAFGDECDTTINGCDPGLFCASAAMVPDCVYACCAEFCVLGQPDSCSGVGQECVPWFAEGDAWPGLEHVGACALP